MSVVKNKAVLASLLVMLLWGLLFPLVKIGYSVYGIAEVSDILTFAGLRFTVCGVVITALTYIKSTKHFTQVKPNIISILLSGFFAIVLHYGFNYTGLMVTDGSKTAIIKQIGTIIFIFFSSFFFREDKLNKYKLIGLILGLAGIFAINFDGGSIHFQSGDLLIIAASFCTVISNVISKKALTKVDSSALTGISQLFGGIVLMLIGLVLGGNIRRILPDTPQEILVFVAIAVASIVSYCLWFSSVQQENLSKLFIIKFAEPLFASLFGWILLGEDILNMNYVMAFILISVGITVANKKEQR